MMLFVVPGVGFATLSMPLEDSEMPGGSAMLVGARPNTPPRRTPAGNVIERSSTDFVPLENDNQGDGSQTAGAPGGGGVGAGAGPGPAEGGGGVGVGAGAGEGEGDGVGDGAGAGDVPPAVSGLSSLPPQPARVAAHPNNPSFSSFLRGIDGILLSGAFNSGRAAPQRRRFRSAVSLKD